MSDIAEWWPKLKPETRQYLIDNNGDVVPGEIVAEIAQAGGIVTGAWWVGQSGPTGFYISDEAADWVEEMANEEDEGRQEHDHSDRPPTS